mgnify:CR=1 FL=1
MTSKHVPTKSVVRLPPAEVQHFGANARHPRGAATRGVGVLLECTWRRLNSEHSVLPRHGVVLHVRACRSAHRAARVSRDPHLRAVHAPPVCLQDVFLTWCCPCCTVTQEYNEIMSRNGGAGGKPAVVGVWCGSVVDPCDRILTSQLMPCVSPVRCGPILPRQALTTSRRPGE